MKFSIAITAIVAFVPIALAAPTPIDLDDAVFNETMTHENELVERKATRNSRLTINVHKGKGCTGVYVPYDNVQYDAKIPNPYGKDHPFQSYEISRNLIPGEVLNFMSGDFDNDVCARVTSHTPQAMRKGCYALGGGTGGGASCFQLWRHQGFIYPSKPYVRLSLHRNIISLYARLHKGSVNQSIMLPTLLPLFILLLLPFTLATTLTLTLPPSTPLLPPSTRAHLTTHGHTSTAPLTRANNFVFRNLTQPGEYNLDIYCRDWDFEPGIVVIPQTEGNAVEVYRRSRKTGQRGGRLLPGEGGAVEVKLGRRREYYEARGGFSLTSMLKSPMILLALVGLGLVFGMPYLLENMDPEMRKEFEEQQKKGVLGGAAGGGNPLQSFDMAGWMAGQTSGQASGQKEDGGAAVVSGREGKAEGKKGGGGGGGGGGQGKKRRG
ncbi:MAG: hypothetical protein LQ338_001606 [Usnochroma carphineum]|nr:MAG: hypothetical protein LQ338_001606 [Usnochroma carphineum]